MKKFGSITIGLLIMVIGVILLGNNINVWNIDIFFDGWWTVFIIVPSFIGLFKAETSTSSLLSLAVGVLLLLAAQEIIDWSMIWRLFVPILLIVIGLSIIFKDKKSKKIQLNKKGLPVYVGVFSGDEERIVSEFKGSNCIAVFGGIELDLTNAIIDEDVVIDCVSVFGGIDLKVPENVNVKTNGTPVFGGVENTSIQEVDDKSHTVYVNYVCVFGGIEIK